MTTEAVNLVLCKRCTAMRSILVPECFCGETAHRPAPEPRKDLTKLFDEVKE